MNIRTASIRGVGALALVLAISLLTHAQAPAAQPPPQGGPPPSIDGKMAEDVYKNIQVLKGTPASELNASMHLIKASLGEDCEYCHVEGKMDKDDKEAKKTARKMITMMMDMNRNSFDGKQRVTCYTCHRGSPDPENVPVLPVIETKETPAPALPPVDQILTKYVEAIGGEQALRKVKTRIVVATQDIPTGPGGTIPVAGESQFYFKAPNLVVKTYHTPTVTLAEGFDGKAAWTLDARGRVTEPLNIDQVRAKRAADFYENANLKREFPDLKVTGIEKVNGHDAYVVVGVPQGDTPERLYFDIQTGLLLRRVSILPTPAGNSPFEINYDDYRDTGSGVKYPFLMRMYPASPRTELAPTSTVKVQKVQDNAPIDDSKFVRPESKPVPPPAPPAGGPK